MVFVEKHQGSGKTPKENSGRHDADKEAGYSEEWITISEDDDMEIEQLIVGKLVKRHEQWIRDGSTRVK